MRRLPARGRGDVGFDRKNCDLAVLLVEASRPDFAHGDVLLVDDHPVVRAGYARFLEQAGDITVVAEAGCATSGYISYLQHKPDVTISDISMPTVGGLELLRKIKLRDDDAKVLMCSMHDGAHLVRCALEGGAIGFVTKNSPPDNLVSGVMSAHQGKRYVRA